MASPENKHSIPGQRKSSSGTFYPIIPIGHWQNPHNKIPASPGSPGQPEPCRCIYVRPKTENPLPVIRWAGSLSGPADPVSIRWCQPILSDKRLFDLPACIAFGLQPVRKPSGNSSKPQANPFGFGLDYWPAGTFAHSSPA